MARGPRLALAVHRCRGLSTFPSLSSAGLVEHRRQDDQAPMVLVARAATPAPAETAMPIFQVAELRRGRLERVPRARTRRSNPSLFVLDPGVGDLLVVTGAEVRQLPRERAASVADLAASEAESLRRQNAVLRGKHKFAEGFVTFVERLNRATTAAEVYDALLQHTPELVGGYGAVLMLAAAGDAGTSVLRALPDSLFPVPPGPLPSESVLPRPVSGPITRAETQPGMPFAPLAPLFTHGAASQLACFAIGKRALLLLVERRADREFTGEDWFRLKSIARHAECVLERLQLLDELHARRSATNNAKA